MFYWLSIASWTLESFWPPRWYVLSSDVFKRQIDLQLLTYWLILKKSVAWVKCIWQSADTKHEQMCEQNSIFPFVRLNLCDFWLWNRKWFCCRCRSRRWAWSVALSFLWFLSRYARKKSFLLPTEGFYINSLNNY